MTDSLPEDPRDALIREQAVRLAALDERIAALEALAVQLREQLDVGPAGRVAELGPGRCR